MHLCTCVSEEEGDRERAGEGGDTKEGVLTLELLSLDTHRREVTGVHGEPRNFTHRNTNVKSDTVSASL